LRVRITDPRDFTFDRHRSVDDKPYGGGPGMVFKPEPVFLAAEHVEKLAATPAGRTRRLLLSPQGWTLTQERLDELAQAERIIVLCGHYEGFDERIREGLGDAFGYEEVSIGDYVLTGGEIPALVLLDGVTRLRPGVLGNEASLRDESFSGGLLEYPQYTRPAEFRGWRVPDILLSGNHGAIARWRRLERVTRTAQRRPDLLETACLSDEERKLAEDTLKPDDKDG
jgi:tRNA (guanine37-N1)-methyltransferase